MVLDADQLDDDAKQMVLSMDAEEVVYVPRSGSERTIMALVDRNPPASVDGPSDTVVAYDLQVHVCNRTTSKSEDDVGGIGSAELDTGGDKIRLATKLGGDAEDRRIAEIVDQDTAMQTLGII